MGTGALERALEMATHAPSAGNTQGWAFIVLEDDETGLFWQHEADSSWLAHPSHPGLLNAPVIILPLASKPSYMERYAEPDKAKVGASRVTDWAVPYWLVDTSFATMLLLLGLTQEGLGSLFFALQKPAGPSSRRSASPTAGRLLARSPSAGRAPMIGPLPPPVGPASPRPRSCTGAAGAGIDGLGLRLRHRSWLGRSPLGRSWLWRSCRSRGGRALPGSNRVLEQRCARPRASVDIQGDDLSTDGAGLGLPERPSAASQHVHPGRG